MKKEILYDDLLKQIPNKYILTIVGGQRAREIGKGAELLTKCSKKDTVIKKVFREVADGKIGYMEAEKQSGEQVEEQ
ncbi:MAG: DNA-directed RNA polymerase subunit omega [Fusobacteriaceae bacterium]|jgi:DNA-directed RNA polymerase subunit omega|nr:DNA-directed RNA polymerase subunit omega [Fusobacteriaceae bacterium]